MKARGAARSFQSVARTPLSTLVARHSFPSHYLILQNAPSAPLHLVVSPAPHPPRACTNVDVDRPNHCCQMMSHARRPVGRSSSGRRFLHPLFHALPPGRQHSPPRERILTVRYFGSAGARRKGERERELAEGGRRSATGTPPSFCVFRCSLSPSRLTRSSTLMLLFLADAAPLAFSYKQR